MIKYTYVKDTDDFDGSYIEYRRTTDSPFDAYYTIHYWNGTKFSDVLVEWNIAGHNGRVQSIDYLGDSHGNVHGKRSEQVQQP
jgi:hypothetical protein